MIVIQTAEITSRSGTSKKTGKPYTLRVQRALCETVDGERRAFDLLLADDDRPYSPGQYTIDPDCLAVEGDGYGARLSVRRPRLLPLDI